MNPHVGRRGELPLKVERRRAGGVDAERNAGAVGCRLILRRQGDGRRLPRPAGIHVGKSRADPQIIHVQRSFAGILAERIADHGKGRGAFTRRNAGVAFRCRIDPQRGDRIAVHQTGHDGVILIGVQIHGTRGADDRTAGRGNSQPEFARCRPAGQSPDARPKVGARILEMREVSAATAGERGKLHRETCVEHIGRAGRGVRLAGQGSVDILRVGFTQQHPA